MNELTDKQREILEWMNTNALVIYPSYREIAKQFGMTVKGAFDHVAAIRRKERRYV